MLCLAQPILIFSLLVVSCDDEYVQNDDGELENTDNLEVKLIEIVKDKKQSNILKKSKINKQETISTTEASNTDEKQSTVAETFVSTKKSKINEEETISTTEESLPVLETQTVTLEKQTQLFSFDYKEKFASFENEIKHKVFEYDLAQTTFSSFILSVLLPWFNQRLDGLKYEFDLQDYLLDEYLDNTIANFILNITFNDDENTTKPLLIKVNCKEKTILQTHLILENVWKELELLQQNQVQFENLSSQSVYDDVIKEFASAIKNKTGYQNIDFIFRGQRIDSIKNMQLIKGNNIIYFTLAIDNKSFYDLSVNYKI